MDLGGLKEAGPCRWVIEPRGNMRVPAILFGSAELVQDMDDKVREQITNVAGLPGIVGAAYAMPDAHWGYGFPIGGVAAFDPEQGGVISAGGVGFDISCGVRALHTGLESSRIESVKSRLADRLFERIPAGVGSTGKIRLTDEAMDAMLSGGARWAVEQGWGGLQDLDRIEEHGRMGGALPAEVSDLAKKRQRNEMGTLGSGNHYLEVQRVTQVFDTETARALGIEQGQAVLCIHCGSRGLGHQIGTEFLRRMVVEAPDHDIRLPDRELACAPIRSDLGRAYIGAMRAGINCALANRQILTHLAREVFREFWPDIDMPVIYDVSHNTCKLETHEVNGRPRKLYVHRKGATRALGAGHPDLVEPLRTTGQPVLIGGTMGTASWVLAGLAGGESLALSSACHGAGRQMSRHQAKKRWSGRAVVDELAARGIQIRSPSQRGVAEEAPGAYKDVDAVVQATEQAGLARKVARLEPIICIKG
jgi:tRNA-splicing ligase RtcB